MSGLHLEERGLLSLTSAGNRAYDETRRCVPSLDFLLTVLENGVENHTNMRNYELIIFFFSVDIGDKCHKLSITNTSVAWNALREMALQDSIASQPPQAQTNRFRKVANMIRFVRRTSAEVYLLKVPDDHISYNDTFIVSVRRLFFELFLINCNCSFLLRLVRP